MFSKRDKGVNFIETRRGRVIFANASATSDRLPEPIPGFGEGKKKKVHYDRRIRQVGGVGGPEWGGRASLKG